MASRKESDKIDKGIAARMKSRVSLNEALYKTAEISITELFNDTSVCQDAAIKNLEGLREHIEMLIDSIA